MVNHPRLLNSLNSVENLATGSKFKRLIHNPFRYLLAQLCRLIFRITGKGIRIKAKTFWNDAFIVELPAGTDIFLTGGKSHSSEIRLSKFLIKSLDEGDTFIDVGSHYGFFSKLAQKCLNSTGKIFSIEPTQNSFQILSSNLGSSSDVFLINSLIGAETCKKEFYEFPALYSEYNTIHPEQFDKSSWMNKIELKKEIVQCITLDSLIEKYNLKPKIIKIDTEGSEFDVIKGAAILLTNQTNVTIVMEYLDTTRGNQSHRDAASLFKEFQFTPFVITSSGDLEQCPNIDQHLKKIKSDSDNIVFKYTGR